MEIQEMFTLEERRPKMLTELRQERTKIEKWIKTTVPVVVVGMTGLGKSTFINSLFAFEEARPKLDSILPLKEAWPKRVWDHHKRQTTTRGRKDKLISGVYSCDPGINSYQVLKMEHCALEDRGNQWDLEVKCRPRGSKGSTEPWINIYDFYPDANVKVKHNYIELTIPSPKEDHEFAVFGTPETKDKKRVQVGIFGKNPMQGKEWEVFVTLFDDTMMAFKYVCEREENRGRQLLTTLAGLFVSNSDEVIKIDMTALEKGWEIKGSKVKTIKSKDAWNSPENSADFPHCIFEIAHVDEAKKSFFCGITVSHLDDTAETEVVTFFEEKKEVNPNDQIFKTWHGLTIHEDNVIDFFVFLQMLVFLVGCFTGVGFDPDTQSAGSVAT